MIQFFYDYFFFIYLGIWGWAAVTLLTATNWKEFSKAKTDDKIVMPLYGLHKRSPFMKYVKPEKRKLLSRLFVLAILLPLLWAIVVSFK